MGGKQKQAQRTKNNARPSNSGRSADLLGASKPQFVSFTGLKETCFATVGFSLAPNDQIDSSVDSNFQLVFKKMNKKDATTKLKALQEFTDLVKSTELDVIKAVLPFWPRLYTTLSTDTDHKVREAAHVSHHQVVLKAKRNLAPYLKQLVGPWFTSQYDTYPPASTAASLAFQDAFPANKLCEAIIFCQDEILNYICDNLTIHTAQTLSNPKTHSVEDAKAKYERVLICSLAGYSLYLNQVPVESVKKAEALNVKIVLHDKFWKLAKNEVPQIRAAWFGALTALCQHAPFLLEIENARVAKAVFSNLDENEPTVLHNVWEAILVTITAIEEWWKYINIDLMLLPKLWKVLQEGGHGNASVIYPNLLPLLSHLPTTINVDTFYHLFFDNMRAGLNQKTVKTSQSESRAVAIALMECLQYTILQNISNITLCEFLIDQQIIPLIESSLENGQAAYKTMFNQLSSLIQYWHRNRQHPDLLNYKHYLNRFWSQVGELFNTKLESYKNSEIISRQIELLMSLKHTVKPKKQMKVKFTCEEIERKDAIEVVPATLSPDQSYLTSLEDFVYHICTSYIKLINKHNTPEIIENVLSLLQEFESERFLIYINSSDNFINLYNDLISKWIKNPILCTRAAVEVLFLIFKYLNAEEKLIILDDINKIQNEDCLSYCIARGLSHPHNADPIVQKWLGNECVGSFLVKIIKQEVNDESTSDLNLLLTQAFTETNDGELFIGKQSVSEILSVLSNCLRSPNDFLLSIDTCASLAAYIASIIYTESLKLFYSDELLVALFTLNFNNQVDADYLSKDTLWEVNTAWQDAISSISNEMEKTELRDLAEKFAAIIDAKFLGSLNGIAAEEIVEAVLSFAQAIRRNNPLFISDLLHLFFERSFVIEWKRVLCSVATQGEILKGNTSFIEFPQNVKETIEDDNIIKYFIWRRIWASVLNTPLEEDEEDEVYFISLTGDTSSLLTEILFDLSLADSLIKNYKSIKYYHKIIEEHKLIKEHLTYILINVDKTTKIKLEADIISKSNRWLWINTLRLYFVDIKNVATKSVYFNIKNALQEDSAKLHLLQAFAQELTYDDIDRKLTTAESIVTLRCLVDHCEDIDVQIAGVFDGIEKLKLELNFTDWEQTQIVVEVIKLCTALITSRKIIELSRRHWDFLVVLLANWTEKLANVNFEKLQIKCFAVAVSQLYSAVEKLIKELSIEQPNSNYVDEWNNVFAMNITTDIVKAWSFLAGKYINSVKMTEVPFLQEFGKVAHSINHKYIFKLRSSGMPKWSKLLNQCCELLISPVNCLQLWGYSMLIVISPGLIELDSISLDTNTPHEKGMIFEQFKGLLVQTHEIVQAMMLDFKLGEDNCRVEPFTDSYTYTFAYLLGWDVLLNICENSSNELRYQYADWLKKEDLLSNLLSSLFKLMPSEVVHYSEAKIKPLAHWFHEKLPLSFDDPINNEKVEYMVCRVYSSTVAQLPASVRQWWSGTEMRTSQIVEKVTVAYVSPRLCQQEIIGVSEHETTFKNMTVHTRPSIREVIAIYTVDESTMELVMTLPANYPLGGLDIQCNRQIAGTCHKQWLLQLRMCVLHQNGRIWDALSLWNNNLNKKFDGVEECYICFAVLHPGTYQVPRLSCKTCRKKFHAACLYKWFSTSNKSTCPICRNLF